VNDTVGDENVGGDNLSAVDEDGAIVHGNGDVGAAHGFKHGVVHEFGAVADGAVYDWIVIRMIALRRLRFSSLPWY